MVSARLSVASDLLYWNSLCWHLRVIRAIALPVSVQDKPCVYYLRTPCLLLTSYVCEMPWIKETKTNVLQCLINVPDKVSFFKENRRAEVYSLHCRAPTLLAVSTSSFYLAHLENSCLLQHKFCDFISLPLS